MEQYLKIARVALRAILMVLDAYCMASQIDKSEGCADGSSGAIRR